MQKVITWWGHQVETFSAVLALCRGNSPVTGEFPHKRQWRGALMFSFNCTWINSWLNNREDGDLRCHQAHYGVIVMMIDDGNWLLTPYDILQTYLRHKVPSGNFTAFAIKYFTIPTMFSWKLFSCEICVDGEENCQLNIYGNLDISLYISTKYNMIVGWYIWLSCNRI